MRRTTALMLLALAPAACGEGDGDRQEQPGREAARPGATTPLEDDQIAALVGLVNGTEVAVAKAVQSKLTLPASRAYAEMLIADHTRLRQAMPSYTGPAIPPPQAAGLRTVFKSQSEMMATLPSGTPFDASFAAIQILDHAMAIDSLRRWHGVARDAELRNAIAAAVPVMESHLRQAQALYSGLDAGASPVTSALRGDPLPGPGAEMAPPMDTVPPRLTPVPDTVPPDTVPPDTTGG